MALNASPELPDAIAGKRILLFVGGVGGVKLAVGLKALIAAENLTIVVNTGDDFWHYGLRICPDIDTVLYTLSGRIDPVNGWGLAQDSITVLDALRNLGEEPWFRLGDKDIATHLLRSEMLRQGQTLTQVVRHLRQSMGLDLNILPMTDDPVETLIDTEEYGELPFQDYFVRHRWQPRMRALRYSGSEEARLSPAVSRAVAEADLILLGPSNPWLSIGPILSLPGLADLLRQRDVPRVAITPIVGDQAIKGPTAKLMTELGYPVQARSVADFYGDVLNGFVYDERDVTVFQSHGLRAHALDTIMTTDADKIRLAQDVLAWIGGW